MTWNKYDFFLLGLITSLAFGSIGGFLTLPRAVSILLGPYFVCCFFGKKCERVKFFAFFFLIWFLYATLSLIWTSDLEEAFKEMFYYPVHFLFFLEILLFSFYATNPLKSLAFGWLVGFLGTAVIASWELITDNHLWMTTQKSGLMMNMGRGVVFAQKFCSVTFMNYNTYVTYVAFMYPFLVYATKDLNKVFKYTCWIIPFIFVGKNASRGGLASITVVLILSYFVRNKFNGKSVAFLITFVVTFFCLFAYTDFFEIILFRMGATDSGDPRSLIWESTLNLWQSTVFIGSGIGSIITSMKSFSNGVLISHNMFLEILVQYGFVVFVPVVMYICSLIRKAIRMDDVSCKAVVVPALVVLPISTIIDSGYLLNPVTFAFFASLEVFANNEYYRFHY